MTPYRLTDHLSTFRSYQPPSELVRSWLSPVRLAFKTVYLPLISVSYILHAPLSGMRILFILSQQPPPPPPPQWAIASSFTRFPDHTQRRTTFGRTPLDGRSARRRDVYLTTHNTYNRPPAGIRTHNLSRRAAAHQRGRPRGHWDRPEMSFSNQNCVLISYFCQMLNRILRQTFIDSLF